MGEFSPKLDNNIIHSRAVVLFNRFRPDSVQFSPCRPSDRRRTETKVVPFRFDSTLDRTKDIVSVIHSSIRT